MAWPKEIVAMENILDKLIGDVEKIEKVKELNGINKGENYMPSIEREERVGQQDIALPKVSVKRKTINLERKIKIIKDYENGKKIVDIAHEMKLKRKTVKGILKDKKRIEKLATSSEYRLINEMEKSLAIWFDCQMQFNTSMDYSIVKTMALDIFETLKTSEGKKSSAVFKPSYKWYRMFREKFKQGYWKRNRKQRFSNVEKLVGLEEIDTKMRDPTEGEKDSQEEFTSLCKTHPQEESKAEEQVIPISLETEMNADQDCKTLNDIECDEIFIPIVSLTEEEEQIIPFMNLETGINATQNHEHCKTMNNIKQDEIISQSIQNKHESEAHDIYEANEGEKSSMGTFKKGKKTKREKPEESINGYRGVKYRIKGPLTDEMEKLMAIWYNHQMQNNLPINYAITTAKALSVFRTLNAIEGEKSSELFNPDLTWLSDLRYRFQLPHWKACSNNTGEERIFTAELIAIIREGGFRPEQIFNVDETLLFWKGVPERHWMYKKVDAAPGFEDRVTLLLGGNAAGFKLKPLFVSCSKYPPVLQNVSKNSLPVYYVESMKKAWLTQQFFKEWFLNCFVPSAQQYCYEKGIPFKLLLLLDNGISHPTDLDLHPDVMVIRVPCNCFSFLQPMNQGVLSSFRAFYLRAFFSQALAATQSASDVFDLKVFWKSYNVLDCISNIHLAWSEVTAECLRGSWNQCLNSFLNNRDVFDDREHDKVLREIVALGKALGLRVNEEEISEFVEFTEGGLTDEDLIDIKAQRHLRDDAEVEKTLTLNGLYKVFSKIDSAMSELKAMDPQAERFNKVEREMKKVLKCYSEVYQKKMGSLVK